MPTDITVSAETKRRAPSRRWLAGPHGVDLPKHGVYDFSLFTHANFTTDGLIPSGTLLGVVTTGGKVGPYDSGASDGRQVAAGVAFNDTSIPSNPATVVTDAYLPHCGVRVSALPLTTGPGALSVAARGDLSNIVFYG